MLEVHKLKLAAFIFLTVINFLSEERMTFQNQTEILSATTLQIFRRFLVPFLFLAVCLDVLFLCMFLLNKANTDTMTYCC